MENFWNELTHHLLGDYSLALYAAGFIFTAIGALISLRLHAAKRDKLSPNTPYKFSWTFMIQDNILRLISGCLMVFAVFRFAPDLLKQDLSMLLALLLGLVSDNLVYIFQKIQDGARKKLTS